MFRFFILLTQVALAGNDGGQNTYDMRTPHWRISGGAPSRQQQELAMAQHLAHQARLQREARERELARTQAKEENERRVRQDAEIGRQNEIRRQAHLAAQEKTNREQKVIQKERQRDFGNEETLTYLHPQTEKRQMARELGLMANREALYALDYGYDHLGASAFYRSIAESFLDIAVGFDPVTGLGRSSYELFTGKNLITGRDLSDFERSVAFLGVVTAGGGAPIARISGRIQQFILNAGKMAGQSEKILAAVEQGKRIYDQAGSLISSLSKHHRILGIFSAEEHNARHLLTHGYQHPPYEAGTSVIQFELTKNAEYVRVFTERLPKSNPAGDWVMKKSAIRGLTAQEIQHKFGLTHLPEDVAVLYLPKGTQMLRGNISEILIQEGKVGKAGTIQYEIFNKAGPIEVVRTFPIGDGVKF